MKWDLTVLYKSFDDPKLEADFQLGLGALLTCFSSQYVNIYSFIMCQHYAGKLALCFLTSTVQL